MRIRHPAYVCACVHVSVNGGCDALAQQLEQVLSPRHLSDVLDVLEVHVCERVHACVRVTTAARLLILRMFTCSVSSSYALPCMLLPSSVHMQADIQACIQKVVLCGVVWCYLLCKLILCTALHALAQPRTHVCQHDSPVYVCESER
jgi:hypothetical protein